MNIKNLFVLFKDIPPIGFGPGIAGYSSKMKKQHHGAVNLFFRVTDKVSYYRIKKHYINAVANALNMGYRLIDYSSAYGDGSLLQKAIQKSGVPREKLFITTRVSNRAQRKGMVREEFLTFLRNMKLDYVDLLQFHWPVTDLYLDTWRDMEKLKDEGLVKHLGVANCHQHHLEEIFKICKHRPEIGQFEIHPLFTQKSLIQYYKEQGIVIEAYTPIARYDDRLVRLPLLKRLEKKYDKTFVQIILRWHIQNGVIPLVRSMSKEHQLENFNIFDFELSQEDMAAIDSININSRLRYDPDNCDFSIL
jgi:diketogulonate reductase-like aldo/keto reductase